MLVRKLVLRGYTVRVLTRAAAEAGQALPSSVEIVEGGLEDAAACRQAIAGADKVGVDTSFSPMHVLGSAAMPRPCLQDAFAG